MPGNEWALMIFTLLAQASVGFFILSEFALKKYLHDSGSSGQTSSYKRTRSLSIVLMLMALAASFFHLGTPLKAIFALNNLKSSWLSREILSAIVYFALFAVLWAMALRKSLPQKKFTWLIVLCGISGISTVICMSLLYMLPGIISWNNPLTLLTFFTSTFLLGFLLFYTVNLRIPVPQKDLFNKAYRLILKATIYLGGFQIVLTGIWAYRLLHLNDSRLQWIFILRIICILLGIGVLFFLHLKNSRKHQALVPVQMIFKAAALLIIISEVLGRYLFYEIFVRIGL